ncbi:MAG: Gfo/Idh/MocA family oxidoreductase [Patescibacteria group bacterium]
MPIISIINDEISDNLKETVAFLKSHKLSQLEMRSLGKKNVANLPFVQLMRHAAYLKKNKIRVSALASPLLKWGYQGGPAKGNILNSHHYKHQAEGCEKIFKIADVFRTRFIRIFSFLRYEGFNIADLDAAIKKLLELAEKYDKILLIENEPVCNIKTCRDLADFINRFPSKRLRVLLDPGNLYHDGDYLDYSSLEPIKGLISYVHIKDYSKESGGYIQLAKGGINYKRFFSWINKDGRSDIIFSLETHVSPERRLVDTAASLVKLKELLRPRRLRYGIVGCGRVYKKHALAIKSCSGAELAGVFDLVAERTQDAARHFDCQAYPSLDQLIADVDIVNICTPHYTHAKIIAKVLRQGKLCLCEKPGSIRQSDIALVKRQPNYKKNLFIVYQNRYNEPIVKLTEIIRKESLGRIIYISGSVRWFRPRSYYLNSWQGDRDKEGGILFNQGAHIIDLIMDFLSPRRKLVIINAWRDKVYHKDIQTEDIILVQFKSGNTLVNLEITAAALPDNLASSLLILTEKGRALVDGKSLEASLDIDSLGGRHKLSYQSPPNSDVYGFGHKTLISHLTNYAKTGRRDAGLVDFDTACRRVELIRAVYKIADK